MRIIAGESKGKRIKSRKGMETRPTLDSVKESLFSIIAPYVPESRFLDLFSGTGNIALEALSRGSKRAVMIEQDPEALKVIIDNINSLGYEGKSRAYKNDVLRATDILGRKGEKFDIIFMDPPYKNEMCIKVLNSIQKNELLADGGLIICEHHVFEDLPEEIDGFKKADERKYGKKCMTFYTR
ncbi:16S rRNA (guanine(966)-N(2))-methyltransferase RsmD [Cetobacterium sp. 2A]|uniref:16S rRNA (guanine(966)-N(2))-methyltransferase RsmD n=1 Tax=Cetobacterium sp. 2A TaxID=2754723 RepID=UPI00163C76B4|nr:16S rRNA (guanine(966)-N(2))-methyltransferase RsmD [Cetobacterium sp. 2A]MBC2855941.1 16S rRNA (guanine(966)-N(2))-methyltransferase RsmD [Cetobacterium sp. 2A]